MFSFEPKFKASWGPDNDVAVNSSAFSTRWIGTRAQETNPTFSATVILVRSLSLATCFLPGCYPSADSNLKAQDVDSILLDGTNKQASRRTSPGSSLQTSLAASGCRSGGGIVRV